MGAQACQLVPENDGANSWEGSGRGARVWRCAARRTPQARDPRFRRAFEYLLDVVEAPLLVLPWLRIRWKSSGCGAIRGQGAIRGGLSGALDPSRCPLSTSKTR